MKKTITISGESRMFAPSDIVQLSVSTRTRDKQCAAAAAAEDAASAALTCALAAAGLSKNEVSISSVSVNPIYKEGVERPEFFECSHSYSVRFAYSPKKLSAAIDAINASDANPTFSVSFTANETEELRTQLLQSVAADSAKRAGVLAAAAGARVGALVSIEHSFSSAPMELAYARFEAAPQSTEFSCSAVFVWELETI